MISLIVLSSSHREKQLKQMIECLEEEDNFKYYQKILIFDGDPKSLKENEVFESIYSQNTSQWELGIPERVNGLYCWANAINEGIERSNFNKILYLDGDRIISSKFLSAVEEVKDNEFLFPRKLYAFKNEMTSSKVKEIKQQQVFHEDIMWEDFRETQNPDNSFRRKNPMSGCVAFTKKTYIRTGGFDQMYVGYGYPDIDYFRKTYNLGCQFNPIDCVEYHLYHDYFPLTKEMVLLHGFWNGIQYCKKWNLNIPESIIEGGKSIGLSLKDTEGFAYLDDFEKTLKRRKIMI